MNLSIKEFNEYLKRNPPNHGYENVHSLLELLAHFYPQLAGDSFESQAQRLKPITESISHRKAAVLLHLVKEICENYEQQAFLDGLHVGAQLILEILELQKTE